METQPDVTEKAFKSTAADGEADIDLDSLLNLEDDFYTSGLEQGRRDGLRQSSFESRVFGVEQGFQKAVLMGRLQARARIWAARLKSQQTQGTKETEPSTRQEGEDGISTGIPPLQANERLQKTLEKHVEKLLQLVDPKTLSSANTDEDVGDFDDRLKKAEAKAKVIELLVREEGTAEPKHKYGTAALADNEIEDTRVKIAEF